MVVLISLLILLHNSMPSISGIITSLMIKSGIFKLVPLLEVAYSVATTDLRDGFPYWIADDRLIHEIELNNSTIGKSIE